jgi:hypothetical protein
VCTSEDKCAQERLGFVRLIYDSSDLAGVMTATPRVTGVLQMISELILMVSRMRMGQLRRIRWRTSQGCGYIRMTRESSGRDTLWYVCC